MNRAQRRAIAIAQAAEVSASLAIPLGLAFKAAKLGIAEQCAALAAGKLERTAAFTAALERVQASRRSDSEGQS